MIALYTYLALSYISCFGALLYLELGWKKNVFLFLISPVFVPFFIGAKIAKI